MQLSFWMYVDVDEEAASGKTYHMESAGNSFIHTQYRFNSWVKVNVVLGDASDSATIFLNFDSATEGYILDRENVQIYLDDFKIHVDEEELLASTTTVCQDGTVTVRNDFGNQFIGYDIKEEIKKGSTVTFDIDFNSSDFVTIWMRANGNWDVKDENQVVIDKNEYYAQIHRGWNGKQTISAVIEEDVQFLQIYIQYWGDEVGWSSKACTISNITITPPDMSDIKPGENTEAGWGPIS